MSTAEDKSIYGQIKFHGDKLAELAKVVENLQSGVDKMTEEAYQRGYDAAKAVWAPPPSTEDYRQYQRGLDHAWEAAKKIVLCRDEGGTDINDLSNMFGVHTIQEVFREYPTPMEAINKINAYEAKQHAADINVGDEVIWKADTAEQEVTLVITQTYKVNGIEWCCGVSANGKTHAVLKRNVCKTGKRYDISGILEEMKHED